MNKTLDDYIIDYTLLDDITQNTINKYQVIPIKKYDIYILIAIVNDIDENILNSLFSYPVKTFNITYDEYKEFYFNIKEKKDIFNLSNDAIKYINDKSIEQSKISSFFDKVFSLAILKKTSDIHIQAQENSLDIRFRIDGILINIIKLRYEIYDILSSALKIYATLDISLKTLPQNGRFSREITNKNYDFRVSFMPSFYGESIVLRILDNKNANIKLHNIGFNTTLYNIIQNSINSSSGMILVTGVTGSGKTTTLYSMLNSINKKEKKIITAEDPIEYKIKDITQVSINNDIGLNYKTILKNALRQDPDVILIGEIRDEEALDIAIQASLTGHLVIATLHTMDAIETLNRLYDLKAKPFLIASVLKLIISQKLYRVLCNNCKIQTIYNDQKIYKESKCKMCNYTGYSKRDIIAQYLQINKDNSKYIKDLDRLKEYEKLVSLNDKLYEKVLDGTTSLNEYYKHEI